MTWRAPIIPVSSRALVAFVMLALGAILLAQGQVTPGAQSPGAAQERPRTRRWTGQGRSRTEPAGTALPESYLVSVTFVGAGFRLWAMRSGETRRSLGVGGQPAPDEVLAEASTHACGSPGVA